MTDKAVTLQELEARYTDMIGFTPPKIAKRLKLGMQVDPALVTALEDWRIAALTPDALDQKTVQLMSFAILLVQTSEAAANHALSGPQLYWPRLVSIEDQLVAGLSSHKRIPPKGMEGQLPIYEVCRPKKPAGSGEDSVVNAGVIVTLVVAA